MFFVAALGAPPLCGNEVVCTPPAKDMPANLGAVLVPVSNQGMKSDFMGFSPKTTRAGVVRKCPPACKGIQLKRLTTCRKVEVHVGLKTTKSLGLKTECTARCVSVVAGPVSPRAPGGDVDLLENNASEGTGLSPIFFSDFF